MWNCGRSKHFVLILAVLAAFFVHEASASEILDPGFGSGGIVTTAFGSGRDDVLTIVVQPDGKILAGGLAVTSPTTIGFALARYNPDGSLDTAFGTGGKVTTDFPGAYASEIQALALQPDGKIVAVGFAEPAVLNEDFAVARYNSNGTLDATFGTGGILEFNIAPAATVDDAALAVAIQADNKIIMAGYSKPPGGDYNFAIARLLPDGSLDTTFNTDGRKFMDFSGGFNDICNDVAIDPATSKIYVAGSAAVNVGPDTHIAVARINPDGTNDTTFGPSANGKAIITFGAPRETAFNAKLQPDGKLLLSGTSSVTTDYQMMLARLDTSGSPDTSFGNNGVALHTFGFQQSVGTGGLDRQADGKIVVGGYSFDGANGLVTAARFNTDGSLDSTFGTSGYAAFNIAPAFLVNAMSLQPDGKVLVAGERSDTDFTVSDFFVVRFANCLFCDDFEDSILDPNWNYVKPGWTEAGGNLVGTPTGKKALAIASPAFRGCTVCAFSSQIETAGGDSNNVSFFAWYTDRKNAVEVMMKQDKGKFILRQKVNGTTVGKTKGVTTLAPNVFYNITVSYDGSQFALIVDGTLLATLPAAGSPLGTAGFQVKKTTASFGYIMVTQ